MQNVNIQEHKIIVIDADIEFGEAFTAEASELGYRVDYFKNITDLGFLGNLSKYDAALVGEMLRNSGERLTCQWAWTHHWGQHPIFILI